MTDDHTKSKFLPLSEATYYIMLALVDPKHGYAVMQEAEQISQGTLRLAPGTIYGAFTTLEEGKLIELARHYQLATPFDDQHPALFP